MLILPCEYDDNLVPTMYDSGRVFTMVNGVKTFVGNYKARTVGEVAGLAYINARAVRELLPRLNGLGRNMAVSGPKPVVSARVYHLNGERKVEYI